MIVKYLYFTDEAYLDSEIVYNLPRTMQLRGLPRWLSDKESTCNAGTSGDMGLIPGSDPLEEGMATHSTILAWRFMHTCNWEFAE